MTENKTKNMGMMLFVFCVALLFMACGPVKTNMLFSDVDELMAEADQLDAANKVSSTYYYWAAKEHLSKARLTHGYSEFDASENFAKKARELASQAVEKAKSGKKKVFEPELEEKKKK